MAALLLGRILGLIELLAGAPGGLALGTVAEQLDVPKSAAHRLLGELIEHGWVRGEPGGRYVLTTRLVSCAFRFLAGAGIDLAQPILNRLATTSGELVRLAVVDGERLTWVAKAQGAKSGLRYDPEMGQDVSLPVTASGHIWLASMPREEALRVAARAGFPRLTEHGPAAPRTLGALAEHVAAARAAGHAMVVDSGAAGMSAMAACVRDPGRQRVIATVSIAGPTARLSRDRMAALVPALLATANELSGIADVLAMTAEGSHTPARTGRTSQ